MKVKREEEKEAEISCMAEIEEEFGVCTRNALLSPRS